MLVEVPDGSGGTLKLAGNPLKMSAFDDPTTRARRARSRRRPRRHPFLHRRLTRCGRSSASTAGLAKLLAGLVLAVLVFCAGTYFQVRGALPAYAGRFEAKGLKAPVEILRDKNAIPHIIAGSIEDAAFGLGFVHAQDRFWQMELMRRLGQGRLSRDPAAGDRRQRHRRHRPHDARPRRLSRRLRQRRRALARDPRACSKPTPPA